ncbi:three-Cys-motif partner protein TcmP [soil metagenome]
MAADFFQVSKEQSRIKAAIVSKYFQAWANVILPTVLKSDDSRIGYVDLFAGPGRYEDGTESTPLAILQTALSNPKLAQCLVMTLNDRDENNSKSLQKHMAEISKIADLKYAPQVLCNEVDDDTAKLFEEMRTIPSLFFIDPWGYKGLSARLVNAAIKDWACEAIFFFNYNRINMGITNEAIRQHLDALLGKSRVDSLRNAVGTASPEQREAQVLEALCAALSQTPGRRYILPFRFLDDAGSRTSHHLIFVTKNFKGYHIMKDVMGSLSSKHDQEVPDFSYVPASPQQDFLHGFNKPLDGLKASSLSDLA